MNNLRRRYSKVAFALLMLPAGLAASAALAASSVPEARARYEQDRAACLGRPNQERATCLREAGAAYAEAGKSAANKDQADYQRNSTKRCDPLPDADRPDCMARMQGQGTTSGSVADGGVSRELVTREVGGVPKTATPVPAASAPTTR